MNWTEYFSFVIFCTIWCLGFFAITRDGKLFDFVSKWICKLPEKIADPIACCVTCMASLHTLVLYGAYCFIFNHEFFVWYYVAIAIPVAFLNEILWALRTVFVTYNTLNETTVKNINNAKKAVKKRK